MSPKRDLTGFRPPGDMPAPPPPPVVAPTVATPAPSAPTRPGPRRGADATAADEPVTGADVSESGPADPRPSGSGPGRPARAPRTAAAAGGRRSGGRPGRKRICVSLTLETSEQLAALAHARRSWKVEVVLEALANWDEQLRAGSEPGERTRFRRRRSSTPTPFVMDLTPEELQRLDALAKAVGSSRSALVRQLVLLEAAASLEPAATATEQGSPPPTAVAPDDGLGR